MNLIRTSLFYLFVTLFYLSGNAQGLIADKIIAKVGGEYILYSDWQESISYLKDKKSILSESDNCAVLENMIVQKFFVHKAKVDSLDVKDEDVEQQLNARIEQILGYMNNDFEKFEEVYGQPVSVVKERFREDLRNQMLTEKLQNTILGDVNVTPQEVETFFAAIPKDSVPYFNAEVEISEIVYKPKANPEQMKLAKEKLEKIRERILAGESFEKLAQQYSEDYGSAKSGGNLGWVKRGNFVPEFEAVAYNLQKDSLSGIVESEYGLHLIQLMGRRGNSILSRHILVKPRMLDEDYTKAKIYLDSIKKVIIKDTMSFEAAVRKYSDKKSESFTNGGRLLNPKSGNYFFETGDLDPDVYFAIDNLKVGEISDPVTSSESDGKKYFRLFKLTSRSAPHKANLKQDYAKIQTAAKELKKSEKFNSWLIQELPKVYTDIDEDVLTICPNLEKYKQKTTGTR